jgi:hypothetical protein
MIFAAKTTAGGLIAFLVAVTFNLDQPHWRGGFGRVAPSATCS